jgi:hypothetical protein
MIQILNEKQVSDKLTGDIHSLEDELQQVSNNFEGYRQAGSTTVQNEVTAMRNNITELQALVKTEINKGITDLKHLSKFVIETVAESNTSIQRYRSEVEKRRKLHNIIEEMKGSILLFIVFR